MSVCHILNAFYKHLIYIIIISYHTVYSPSTAEPSQSWNRQAYGPKLKVKMSRSTLH